MIGFGGGFGFGLGFVFGFFFGWFGLVLFGQNSRRIRVA